MKYLLTLFLCLSFAVAQNFGIKVEYGGAWLPNGMLPALVNEYNTAFSPDKPFPKMPLMWGGTFGMSFKAPLGFWVGPDFGFMGTVLKAKTTSPLQTRALRVQYNTVGLSAMHYLLGTPHRKVALVGEVVVRYGRFMTRTKIKQGRDNWHKYDNGFIINGVPSVTVAPALRIRREKDGSDYEYFEIKPYFCYAFRQNLSFEETANALLPAGQLHAPYQQSLPQWGLIIGFPALSLSPPKEKKEAEKVHKA